MAPTQTDSEPAAETASAEADAATPQTTVTVRATGHVRTELGTHELSFTFTGTTLREFLDQFFAEYDVQDLVMAETEADEQASGWAPEPEELPGMWKKNPEGERTRAFARVTVNGRFNEHVNGFDTELSDEDRVALIYPFVFCL